MANPFHIKSAELMTHREVAHEFVREHTEHAKLASHSHTVVWGSRGSGKSMHFKYLEPMTQGCPAPGDGGSDVDGFLQKSEGFVGVYINCRDPILNRRELRQLSQLPGNQNLILSVLEGYFASAVIKALAETVLQQMATACRRLFQREGMPAWLSRVAEKSDTSVGDLLEVLRGRCDEWLDALEGLIADIYRWGTDAIVPGSMPTDAPTVTTTLDGLLRWLQGACQLHVPFFLLFDEANELSEVHQRCTNSLMSVRSQNYLCVKVASQRNGFRIGPRLDGTVDETHDFTTLDLDGLYTNNREAYYKRIERIANYRLNRAGVAASIQEYLPGSPREVEALEEARELAAQRYDELEPAQRPADKANYIKKYAPALVFQEVLSPKSRKTYAGFGNVVHLSSGIVRSFLDCCSKMYARYVENNPGEEAEAVPVGIQGDVIREYSDQFIEAQLVEKVKALDPNSEERQTREKLHRLLLGLGAMFRDRLMDKASREPRIISVSLKDEPGEELRKVLDLAEREAFLHVKWYRSKRGNRNLRCYVLNRRLCPHFNLDLTGFQGRLELTASQMSLALQEPDSFAKETKSVRESEDGKNPRQLVLFDM